MARDYKHRKRRSGKASGGLGFPTGLVCGLAVAFIVHLYHVGQRGRDEELPNLPKPAPPARAPAWAGSAPLRRGYAAPRDRGGR